MSIVPQEYGPLIGAGKEAEVYGAGDLVLKLYRQSASKASAFREAAALSIIEGLDLPAPKVQGVCQFHGRWGLLMTRAEGQTFGETIMLRPEELANRLHMLAKLQAQIHVHSGKGLAGLKARLRSDIEGGMKLPGTTKRSLLNRLERLPDGDRLCHGDFHPWNVLGSVDGTMVIDWLDASRGEPAADVCRTYVLLHHKFPMIAEAYLEVYTEVSALEKQAVLAWLPLVAAARLAEGVPDEVESLLEFVEAAETN
ncbi:phosphotransferase family protein [Rhizobium sullae]|uniref:Ser/Thr protein kinase RdoA (MazF antagonist) n=1 Tax=Rhizobium sullae TaxID=50338 RepID=A0A4R3QP34_RHISU|nr:aminoglycoside phosphotransferase family protein [Rhizobium sullae]TCU20126.1 Ser/Thr protein kinase RdoA (MazF antagonist) [Rhizobium sullae]